MGKIIVLNRNGHDTLTTELKSNAMTLLKQGYDFWTNVAVGEDTIELGVPVKATEVTEDMSLVALRPIAGG